MAKPEQALWAYVREGMRGSGWHAQRHEDALALGVPDVSYGLRGAQGWIELKCLPGWPAKRATVVKIGHFTGPQRAWLRARGKAGGRCFLLLKVADGPDYFLVPWTGVTLEDEMTREDYLMLRFSWSGAIDWRSLASALVG